MQLMKHQKEALNRTKNFSRCAYYHDMGLGKTFTGSQKAEEINNPVTLLICQKSKVKDWFSHYRDNHLVGNVLYDLTDPKQYQDFLSFDSPLFNRIGIINYDLLIRRPDLKKLKDFTLMLDESQAIQNETAKRTKYILKMKPSAVILLSGTPISGKYEQLYAQVKLLGWNISKGEFWKRYINYREWVPVDGMFPIKIVTGYKNVDDLKANLREHGADFLKTEEVLTLPEQVFQTIAVKRPKEYKQFMKDKIVTVEGLQIIGDTVFNHLLSVRKLCGMYSPEKFQAFKDILDSTNDRVVVFYNFCEELRRLKELIKDRPSYEVNGEKNEVDKFNQNDNAVLLVQYQAGSSGLNLQKANRIVYFTPPLSVALFEQSKKRIHRIGQKQTCFYYFLVCEDTKEEDIYNTLALGKDYNEALFEHDR